MTRRHPGLRVAALALAAATLACNTVTGRPPPTARPWPTATPVTLTAMVPASPTAPDVTVTQMALAPEYATAGDPYAPELGNSGYDMQRYTLRVALRPGVEALEATATLELESTEAGLEQVALDFVGFEIDHVSVDGAPTGFGRLEEKLLVVLPAPLDAGEPAAITVDYHGAPVQAPSIYVPFIAHLGLQFAPDHIYVVSEPDGARYWFPANDHPRDKATFRFEVVVPPGLTGVANGELVATQPAAEAAFADGEPAELFVWEHDYPMAPYHATVAVGPYVRLEDTSPGGVPLRHYLFEDDRAALEPYRATIGEMVDWFSERLGPYPFEAFGFVLVDQLGGALETQTMVVVDRASLGETILAHELAHMWFGDWVSLNSWGEMWRSEGAANYFAGAWLRRTDPDQFAQDLAPGIAAGPQASFPLGDPPPEALFSGPVYEQGALFLADLRQTMGDEAFFAGLQTYFEDYGGGTASDAEFQAVMEAAAGRSLDDLFARWLK